jgi:hypothetical protein
VKGNIDVSIRHAVTKQVCKNAHVGTKDFCVVENGMPFEIVVTADLVEPPTDPSIEFCIHVNLSGKSVKTISRSIALCREPIVIDSITTDKISATKKRMVSAMVFRSPDEVSSSSSIMTSSEPLMFSFTMCYGRTVPRKRDVEIEDMTLPSMVVDSSKKFFERPTVSVSALKKHICNVPTHVFEPLGKLRVITKWVETEAYIFMNVRKRIRENGEDDGGEKKRKRIISS